MAPIFMMLQIKNLDNLVITLDRELDIVSYFNYRIDKIKRALKMGNT
jgi:hypothetical protein